MACSSPPPPPPAVTCTAGFTDVASLFFGDEGAPVTVELALPLDCTGTVTADVAVQDPSNTAVDFELASVGGQGGVLALVRFTPRRGGLFHVTARFQPNLGLTQADVFVAGDRRDAGGQLLPSSLRACAKLDFTSAGAVHCLDAGEVLGEDVLWTRAGERFVLGGDGGFVRTPDVSLGLTADLLVGPTAQDVFVIEGLAPLRRVRLASDGGLAIEAYEQVGAFDIYDPWWRSGNTLLTGRGAVGENECHALDDAGLRLCDNTVVSAFVEPAGMWIVPDGFASVYAPNETRQLLPLTFSAPPDATNRWNTGAIATAYFTRTAEQQEYAFSWRSGGIVMERFVERNQKSLQSTGKWIVLDAPFRAVRK